MTTSSGATAAPGTAHGAAPRTAWPVPASSTRRVLWCCWLAILAEGYDVGVLGAVLPALREYEPWALTPLQLGGLGSYALIGMMIGAMLIGSLSDRFGRRLMLVASIALFSLAQLGAALAPTPELFGLFRLIGGLGMGGVIPVAAALTIEYSPPPKRSLNYALMYSGYSLGILAAALVALGLLPHIGWRGVVGVGALPLFLLPLIWRLAPESLESLLARGRTEQARRQAAALGVEPFVESDWLPRRTRAGRTSGPAPGPVPGPDARPDTGPDDVGGPAPLSWRDSFTVMFSGPFLRGTIGFWIALFCGLLLVYGLNTWLPSIMLAAGYDLGSSLAFLVVFSLASALGGILIGGVADRFGKKPVLIAFYLLGAAGILLLMFPGVLVVNYLFVALAGVGSIATSLVLTGWVADYYPAHARGTATGSALSFARIGAIAGPLIGGWIGSAQLPFQWNFVLFAAIGALAAASVAVIPTTARATVTSVTSSGR